MNSIASKYDKFSFITEGTSHELWYCLQMWSIFPIDVASTIGLLVGESHV